MSPSANPPERLRCLRLEGCLRTPSPFPKMELALWHLEARPLLSLPHPQPLLLVAPFSPSIFTFPLFLLQDQRKEGRLKEAVVCPSSLEMVSKGRPGRTEGWSGAQGCWGGEACESALQSGAGPGALGS